jgi:cytochrome c-type biogenesis protein CcmH/NrfF
MFSTVARGEFVAMSPSLLRLADSLLGIPLCLLLTAARKVARAFVREKQPAAERSILFIKLAE